MCKKIIEEQETIEKRTQHGKKQHEGKQDGKRQHAEKQRGKKQHGEKQQAIKQQEKKLHGKTQHEGKQRGKKLRGKKDGHEGFKRWLTKKSVRNFIIFLEILLIGVFLTHPDLYYDPTAASISMRFYADSIIICGGLWLVLFFLTIKPIDLKPKVNKILTWIVGLGMPLACFFWLECFNNKQFWLPIFQIPLLYLALDLAIYYVIYLLLLLIINNVKYTSIVMILITAFFGIANWELTLFRSMSFIASDIYSFKTAALVANTYKPELNVPTAEFFLLALVMVALLLKLDKIKLFRWKGRLAYLVICVAMCAGFGNVYVYSDYLENIGVDFRVYRPQNKYRYYGTLLTTVRTFGYLHVREPEGYSTAAVKKISEQQYNNQTSDQDNGQGSGVIPTPEAVKNKKPNIICIMNESFADLSQDGNLEVSEDYMPFFRSLKKNVVKGYTYSSVFGGNTANSEFEFLTGNSMAFLPDNSVPYQLFLRDPVPGLTANLKAQGYPQGLALHPFYNTGYSRYKVYPLMGFDKFLTSDDFSVFTETVNYHITDEEDYKKIINLYEESKKESDAPFYLFNVTMQNHGSYDGSTYETGDDVQIQNFNLQNPEAEEYLNMIKMSDNALKDLVNYFKEQKDPTVLLFFGDHQPDLDEEFYSELMQTDISTLDGENLEKLYKIPFVIWANYDIGATNVERTSNNYLSTYLAEVAGIKKSRYQEFLTNLRSQIPAINAYGYWDKDGNFYDTKDKKSPYYKMLQQYNMLEYNDLFGKDERLDNFFYVDPAQANKTGEDQQDPDKVY